MNPIESVLHKIQREPDLPSSKVLRDLLMYLDSEVPFDFKRLYSALDYKEFCLALETMQAWRLEERRVTKGRLSTLVEQPKDCVANWLKSREQDFGLVSA